jgi:thioredoxin reductase
MTVLVVDASAAGLSTVEALRRKGYTVRTASGRDLHADTIVIATGVRPRTLPGHEGLAGLHAQPADQIW